MHLSADVLASTQGSLYSFLIAVYAMFLNLTVTQSQIECACVLSNSYTGYLGRFGAMIMSWP